MRPLFDITQPIDRSQTYLFECENCKQEFSVDGMWLSLNMKMGKNAHKFCSKQCQSKAQIKVVETICTHCKIIIIKYPSQQKRSKSGHHFCSRSCAAKYNNAHKISGTRKSKLESWLQEELKILFPKLHIIHNDVKTINSELDIYLPEFKLAFELNGIFHYEPIYGVEKLASIQNNDNRKFQACLERDIELVILDTSKETYFKPEKGQKYLKIIQSIIELKVATPVGLEPT